MQQIQRRSRWGFERVTSAPVLSVGGAQGHSASRELGLSSSSRRADDQTAYTLPLSSIAASKPPKHELVVKKAAQT